MERYQFKVAINAPKEKVWSVLWSNDTYGKWASAFCEGAYVITDWKKGSKALFLDKEKNGMVSVIEENTPATFMSIKHLGEVVKGVEDTDSDKVRLWAGAMENYTLQDAGSGTMLTVDMDLEDSYKDYFTDTFPKALHVVKELAEQA